MQVYLSWTGELVHCKWHLCNSFVLIIHNFISLSVSINKLTHQQGPCWVPPAKYFTISKICLVNVHIITSVFVKKQSFSKAIQHAVHLFIRVCVYICTYKCYQSWIKQSKLVYWGLESLGHIQCVLGNQITCDQWWHVCSHLPVSFASRPTRWVRIVSLLLCYFRQNIHFIHLFFPQTKARFGFANVDIFTKANNLCQKCLGFQANFVDMRYLLFMWAWLIISARVSVLCCVS